MSKLGADRYAGHAETAAAPGGRHGDVGTSKGDVQCQQRETEWQIAAAILEMRGSVAQ
jgi:hypothetical protein